MKNQLRGRARSNVVTVSPILVVVIYRVLIIAVINPTKSRGLPPNLNSRVTQLFVGI